MNTTHNINIIWVSRHDLTADQLNAINEIHGGNVNIIKKDIVFNSMEHFLMVLRDLYNEYSAELIYVVAPSHYIINAVLNGINLGLFENNPKKRADGSFGLMSVYHIVDNKIIKVWEHPEPDNAELSNLAPISRC